GSIYGNLWAVPRIDKNPPRAQAATAATANKPKRAKKKPARKPAAALPALQAKDVNELRSAKLPAWYTDPAFQKRLDADTHSVSTPANAAKLLVNGVQSYPL